VRTIVHRLALATAFLTRLPVPVGAADATDVGRSVACFPLVGLLLGALLVTGDALLGARLPGSVLAVLLVALLAALSGGLHLDGVADTFDALGSPGADRARRLEILRDSRIGAHGATALVLVVLVKVTAVHAVLAGAGAVMLPLFPMVGRCLAACAVVGFPYAREQGVGAAFASHARPIDAAAAVATTVLVATLLGGAPALVAALLAAALVWCFVRRVARVLGGITGDVCGAAIELGECAFLVVLLACRS